MNENEKKVLLGETTFISITMVAAIIGAVYLAGYLSNQIDANAKQIDKLQADHFIFVNRIEKNSLDTVKELRELNKRLGRIEGHIKINYKER